MGTISLVVIGGVAVLLARNWHAHPPRAQKRSLKRARDFRPDVTYLSTHGRLGLALDAQAGRFAVTGDRRPAIYRFDELIDVDILRDGNAVSEADAGSLVGGAVVGGLLLGPVGLLLGGLSASRTSRQKIEKLSLRLTTNNLERPVTEIVFFRRAGGVDQKNKRVRLAGKELDEWHARFRAILRGQQAAYLQGQFPQADVGHLDHQPRPVIE